MALKGWMERRVRLRDLVQGLGLLRLKLLYLLLQLLSLLSAYMATVRIRGVT